MWADGLNVWATPLALVGQSAVSSATRLQILHCHPLLRSTRALVYSQRMAEKVIEVRQNFLQ